MISLYEGLSQEASVIFQQLKDNGVPVLIVYTKQDLVNQERQQQVIQQVKQLIKEYSISLCRFLPIFFINSGFTSY